MSKQSVLKKERLLQKAEVLFLKYGYKSVSMDHIAQEANVSKMTIYKYYPSKDTLFIEVLKTITDRHFEIIELRLAALTHSMDKIQCLYDYSLSNANVIPESLIREIMERSNVLEAISQYKQQWTSNMWQSLLKQGIESGDLRPLDTEMVALILMNLPMVFMKTDFFSSPEQINRVLKTFYDFIQYGLLGSPKPSTVADEAGAK